MINLWIKVVLSIIALSLALFRWFNFEVASERMDSIFLLLLTIVVLIFIIPFESLKSIKAGGVELILDQPQVKGAIDGLGLKRIENKQLRQSLKRLSPLIEQIRGSRVLWIDDRQYNILGERRLLRALGIVVVTAISSEKAEEMLFEDDDFDMIISDVQRKGMSYKLNNGEAIHEGVNFIVALRKGYLFSLESKFKQYLQEGAVNEELKKIVEDKQRSLSRRGGISKIDEKCWEIVDYSMRYRSKDTGTELNVYDDNRVINSLPVIFYAAYPWKKLFNYTIPAREPFIPEVELSNSIEMLVTKIIIILSKVRSNPIPIKLKKEPTPAA